MKKCLLSFLFLICLFIFSCGSDDDLGLGAISCIENQIIGLVDIKSTTKDLISDELLSSTTAIYVNEDGDSMVFNIIDENGGQEYFKHLGIQEQTFACKDGGFFVSHQPQNFFIRMLSEDQFFELQWRILITSAYNQVEGQMEFKDEFTISGFNNARGDIVIHNNHSDGSVGPEQIGGAEVSEVLILGESFFQVRLDQPEIDNSNLVLNKDFGIAAFKDRFGNWWRHVGFQ